MASREAQTAEPPIRGEGVVVAHEHAEGANHKIELSIPGWPGARPGQFLMISPGPLGASVRTDPLLPRPMAVFRQAADPDRAGAARVQILYKAEGRGTQLIADARIGDRLSLVGPLGRPFPSIEAGERVVLVGGGTGVASLYELAAAAPDSAEVRLILGARSRNDLMGQADFAALPGRLDITTEDGSLGTKGRVTDLLGPLLESADASSGAASWLVRACGPTPMMRACADLAAAAGAACLVSLENNMACGFGVCLGCAAPKTSDGYALVCKAGPVFDAREIAWEKMP